MKTKIRRLDAHTINQIAAGEVIENPASVVKELVENSIDAGATEIYVEIYGGGRQRIRVTDNGTGMSSEDALLSLEKHATSKISSVDDLWQVKSLGFRGEAIPSIASISKFSLMTREKPSKAGSLIIVEGGKFLSQSPLESDYGTMIQVDDLFFNLPARKQFQRAPKYDIREVEQVIIRESLAYPEISFKLISDGKKLVNTIYSSDPILPLLEQRARELLDEKELIAVERQENGLQLLGWISPPHLARAHRKSQILMINRRVVSSVQIAESVKQGYGPTIAKDRFPFFVLHLFLDANKIDVNVHPQKQEVRLQQPQFYREWIFHAVDRALQKQPGAFPPLSISDERFIESQEVKKKCLPWDEKPLLMYEKPCDEPIASVQEQLPLAAETFEKVATTVKGYLILEGASTSLQVIDQHAAHARILYEQLVKNRQQGYHLEMQMLLIPELVTLTNDQIARLDEKRGDLERLGIALEDFGKQKVVLNAIPKGLSLQIALDMLKNLLNDDELDSAERQLSLMARQKALSSSYKLTCEEGQALLDQLNQCTNRQFCPKGTPIFFKLDIANLIKHA